MNNIVGSIGRSWLYARLDRLGRFSSGRRKQVQVEQEHRVIFNFYQILSTGRKEKHGDCSAQAIQVESSSMTDWYFVRNEGMDPKA